MVPFSIRATYALTCVLVRPRASRAVPAFSLRLIGAVAVSGRQAVETSPFCGPQIGLGASLQVREDVSVGVVEAGELSPFGLGVVLREVHALLLERSHGLLKVLDVEGDARVPRLELPLAEVKLPGRALGPDGDPVVLDRGVEAQLRLVPLGGFLRVRDHYGHAEALRKHEGA